MLSGWGNRNNKASIKCSSGRIILMRSEFTLIMRKVIYYANGRKRKTVKNYVNKSMYTICRICIPLKT